MTIIYTDEYGIQARMRKRRRKIACARRERLSARAQRVFVILTVCMITILAGYIGIQDGVSDTGLAYTAQAAEETLYINVTVQKGDTLWGIVSEYTEPSKDIRKQIKEICAPSGTPGSGRIKVTTVDNIKELIKILEK